ncbi:DUF6895 family protein [Streptomyces griseorubiginosus]|uniref:DUF6895 family protein n=1 Tax=Streptomyces griseorubiginosus TaxID=67304 RepID=UPI002E81D6F9|nr:hypothetical protein [Streptomyces griseorubiginosus]WUB47427.1 hypothetical protein OHN19_30475 [Streptomyces griseorubiginosus]WUB55951.1 hypothetical protein OG942_30480 [Streptomyces griseorubiginosus]
MTAAPEVRPARGVRELGEAALRWVSAHRDGFALDEDALAEHGDVNTTWKPLGELAQVCVCVRRHTERTDPLHVLASDLLAFAWQQTGRGALFVELQRLEPFATYPLEVYAAFASAGLRHDRYENATATVARTRGWQVTEQEPNRRLSVLNSERRSGLPEHGDMGRALERTWLAGLPEPWTFELAAGYTLTHVIFHLTDWGLTPRAVPPPVADYLRHWLPPWLDTCLEDEQWDLGCELLAVASSLPGPPERALLQESWARLAVAQDDTGAVPEVGGRGSRTTAPAFLDCYHSTLMTAFAAALTLDRLRAADGQGVPG